MSDIQRIVDNQRSFFQTGKTLTVSTRIQYLKSLRDAINSHTDKITNALKADLNKSTFESYITEIGMVIGEINYMIKHAKRLSRTKRVTTSIMNFPSKGYIYQEPYGVTLIMSPWNYPFQLSLSPLAGAIAAGNCVILKPSNYSSAVSSVIAEIIESVFPPEYVTVIKGGRDVNQSLLDNRFDLIFFTGGVTVGRLVMEKASKFLTPVVLELGGKSPCIVDETADIPLTAKRLTWGKGVNSGQTCVAPDYLLVQRSVHDKLLSEMKKDAAGLFSDKPSTNENFPKIITQKHFERLSSLLDDISSSNNTSGAQVVYGGSTNPATQQIDLTFVDGVQFSDKIMQEEIFGPILPIITFDTLKEVATNICSRPKPLALYFFTSSRTNQEFIMNNIPFGGGCINDTIMHLVNDNLPFGGVGDSGMGSYHGKQSFLTFSHAKSVLKKSTLIDVTLRYPPYENKLLPTVKKIMT